MVVAIMFVCSALSYYLATLDWVKQARVVAEREAEETREHEALLAMLGNQSVNVTPSGTVTDWSAYDLEALRHEAGLAAATVGHGYGGYGSLQLVDNRHHGHNGQNVNSGNNGNHN